MKETFLVLVAAHFIADFLLQPDWLQQKKNRLWANLLHAAIVAGLTALLLQQGSAWFPAVLIFVSHASIDAVKQRIPDTWQSFCVDQAVHLLFLGAILQIGYPLGWFGRFTGLGLKWMILVAGFSVAVQGAGFLVGKVALKLQEENALAERINGLENGGRLIGQLERALIFLFVMIGQPAGIGFLVAAKSILRFGEARDDQKLAEYVLIGTLLSFGLAIASASLTKLLLK